MTRFKNILLTVLSAGLLVLSTDAEEPQPRLTTDKQPLPKAGERKLDVKLQTVGRRLGALPEEASPRIWEIKGDLEFVRATRRAFTEAGADLKNYDYVGDGFAGATKSAFDVDHENGRVRRILLLSPGTTGTTWQSRIEKIAMDSDEKPMQSADMTTFKVDGVQIYMYLHGKWEKTKLGERGYFTQSETKKISGPALLEIGVAALDWKVLNSCETKEMYEAITNGNLVVGMNYQQAYMTLRDQQLSRIETGEDMQQWIWSTQTAKITDYRVISDTFGTTVAKNYRISDVVYAKADFKNGLIVKIYDVGLKTSGQ